MAKIIETLNNISEYPNSFKRQGAFPLDSKSVFQELSDAETYAQDKSAAATSYVGQIISVVENNTVNVYKIVDTAGNLELIGTQANWEATSGVAQILNKPNMKSGVDAKGDLDTSAIVLAGNGNSQAYVENGIAVGPNSIAGGLAFLVKEVGYYDGTNFISKDTQKDSINAFKLITSATDNEITINTILKGDDAGSSWPGNGRVVTFQAFDWANTTMPAAGEPFSFQTARWNPTYTTIKTVMKSKDNSEVTIVFNDNYTLNTNDANLIRGGGLSSSGWCCWFPQRPTYGTVRITDIDGEGSPPGILTCIALGVSAQARNTGAIAIGREVLADGPYSMALTKGATAKGQYAIAAAESAVANGEYAVAIGQSAIASAQGALALGRFTSAQGDGAVALGKGTTAGGAQSFAFGKGCQATGASSVAGGLNSIAQGYVSMAIGSSAQAQGTGAIALGSGTQARGDGAVALGYGQIHDGSNAGWYRYAFAAGKGIARGTGAVAFGQGLASGTYSFAFGDQSMALGQGSFAFGVAKPYQSSETDSSEGLTQAEGECSFAFGSGAQAIGNYSFAFGKEEEHSFWPTKAEGEYSFAFGQCTQASGMFSLAFGEYTSANENYSIAIGSSAIANGEGCIAIGTSVSANSIHSVALGYDLWTQNSGEVALGANNSSIKRTETQAGTAFTIGKGYDPFGTGAVKANNLFQIDTDGTVHIINTKTGALMNLQELLNSLSTT